MSESIWNTIIISITSIVVALIGLGQLRQGRRTKEIEKQVVTHRKDTTAIKDQVVNHHADSPGLREDIDELKGGVIHIMRDIGGLREEQRQTRREVYEQGVYGRENRHLIHKANSKIAKLSRKLEDTERIEDSE